MAGPLMLSNLQRAVAKLRSRSGQPTLLNAVETALTKHQKSLSEFYRVQNREDLWNSLSSCDSSLYHYNQSLLEKRHTTFNEAANRNFEDTSSYNEFVRELYPLQKESDVELSSSVSLVNWFTNSVKYSQINHKKVFEAYTKLSNPFSQLQYAEYTDFVNKFLFNNTRFKKPNVLSESTVDDREQFMVLKDFNDMQNKRNAYVKQMSRILGDLTGNGFELTPEEQNAMIYCVFFRDPSKILDKLREVPDFDPLDRYARFDMPVYLHVISTMKEKLGMVPIDTYNILLFHAIRHNQHDILEQIIESVGLQEATLGSRMYNNKTVQLVMPQFARVPGLAPLVESTIDGSQYDIESINTLLSCLFESGNSALAQELFSSLFVNTSKEEIDEIEKGIYKLLTPQDKRFYRKLILMYENITRITGEQFNFSVYPIQKTFQIMLKYADEQDAMKLLDTMTDKYDLPISTQTFAILYDKLERGSDISSLVTLTSRLVSLQDSMVSLQDSALMKHGNGTGDFSKQVEAFMADNMVQYNLNIPQGAFLKLTDSLVEKIYRSFLSVLTRAGASNELLNAVRQQQRELSERVSILKGHTEYAGTSRDTYILDEVSYVKKTYLVDLVYMCC